MSGENTQLTLLLMIDYEIEPCLALQTVNNMEQDKFDGLVSVVGRTYLNNSVIKQLGATKLDRTAVKNILKHRKVTLIEVDGAVALVKEI